MVNLKDLSDYETLKRDNWGIPTIDAKTVGEREHVLGKGRQPLDLVLMPGVAFDAEPKGGFIRRLGHGKGFYDYFLHRYKQIHGSLGEESGPGTNTLLYGLALKEQLMTIESDLSVPVGEHDNLLHGLFVGDGRIVEGPIAKE